MRKILLVLSLAFITLNSFGLNIFDNFYIYTFLSTDITIYPSKNTDFWDIEIGEFKLDANYSLTNIKTSWVLDYNSRQNLLKLLKAEFTSTLLSFSYVAFGKLFIPNFLSTKYLYSNAYNRRIYKPFSDSHNFDLLLSVINDIGAVANITNDVFRAFVGLSSFNETFHTFIGFRYGDLQNFGKISIGAVNIKSGWDNFYSSLAFSVNIALFSYEMEIITLNVNPQKILEKYPELLGITTLNIFLSKMEQSSLPLDFKLYFETSILEKLYVAGISTCINFGYNIFGILDSYLKVKDGNYDTVIGIQINMNIFPELYEDI